MPDSRSRRTGHQGIATTTFGRLLLRGSAGSGDEARANALLDVDLEDAKGRFVSLHGHRQGVEHSLRRVEVRDDPLGDGNRRGGDPIGWGLSPKSMISSSGVPVTRQKLA
jgi:hypothetical protein